MTLLMLNNCCGLDNTQEGDFSVTGPLQLQQVFSISWTLESDYYQRLAQRCVLKEEISLWPLVGTQCSERWFLVLADDLVTAAHRFGV